MHSTDRHIRTHRHHHETVSIVLLRKLHTRSHAGKAKLVVILTHTHTHTHTHTSYLRLHSQQRLADIIPDFDDAWHTRFNAVTSPKHRIPRARGIGELCH